MKKLFLSGFIVFFVVTILIFGCKPDPGFETQVTEEPIAFTVPQGWPSPYYKFENNTLTRAGFELGRKLFYDPRLSRDNSISCGSCHQQSAAFAHSDHTVSHGIEDKLGNRNSPSLFNLNWHTSFFWDGGVNHLESQPINPIQNPVEMDENLPNIITKLSADSKYKSMFKAAYGDELINSQRIFKALAQFMGMLVSSNSKYDKFKRGETSLTAEEMNGYTVFAAKCGACHKEPLFTDFTFRNNGLPVTVVNDSGRAHITKDTIDLYKFKVPSLRNLAYTGPYMHDGRFNSLDDVLNHYATGVKVSATLDALLTGGIQLTSQERSNLLAFLNTLNDATFIRNTMFAEVKQ